jgi:NADPH:quinone reductase-like Zn-dependent oxidoreductase
MQNAQTSINVAEIMRKNLVITGSMLKPQPLEVKALLASEIEARIWPWITAGKIRPVINRIFPLADAAAAQQLMESTEHIGKIILTI